MMISGTKGPRVPPPPPRGGGVLLRMILLVSLTSTCTFSSTWSLMLMGGRERAPPADPGEQGPEGRGRGGGVR